MRDDDGAAGCWISGAALLLILGLMSYLSLDSNLGKKNVVGSFPAISVQDGRDVVVRIDGQLTWVYAGPGLAVLVRPGACVRLDETIGGLSGTRIRLVVGDVFIPEEHGAQQPRCVGP